MKRIRVPVFPLFVCVFIFVCLGLAFASGKPDVLIKVEPEEAVSIMEDRAGGGLVVLDVRTQREYAGGHIPDAVNIDFYGEGFSEEIAKLDPETPYILYCKSGVRSGKTLNLMGELGFSEVYEVEGGIRAWVEKELPVETD